MTLSSQTKIFAPANLRCTAEDPAYKKLVEYYMEKKLVWSEERKGENCFEAKF